MVAPDVLARGWRANGQFMVKEQRFAGRRGVAKTGKSLARRTRVFKRDNQRASNRLARRPVEPDGGLTDYRFGLSTMSVPVIKLD
jgi:hypothetical protein